MKKQNLITIGIIIAVFVIAIFGFIQLEKFRVRQGEKKTTTGYQPLSVVTVPAVETEKAPEEFVEVKLNRISKPCKNVIGEAIIFTVEGLARQNIRILEYAISYETRNMLQGIDSGRDPVVIKEGQDLLEREFFLGTFSAGGRCTRDENVKEFNVSLKLTDKNGNVWEWEKIISP